MATEFPSTIPAPSIRSSGAIKFAQVRTPMEAGYVQSRKKYTRSRKMYKFIFPVLDSTQFNTLEQFFLDNQGGKFTYSQFSSTKEFRFSDDKIDFKWISGHLKSATINIEEV